MSHKEHIPDQITCRSIKLAGPIQGKKIEIQFDVKPIRPEKKSNSNWETLGFLFLILFFLIVIVGQGAGLDSSPNDNLSPHPHNQDSQF
ncbi:MAG TPA: hypothetical protein V6D21_05340 [Candidatus Obscuribacterales bacterium]